MVCEESVELDVLPGDGSVGSWNEDDDRSDNEWEAFDAAFRGKTAGTPSSAAAALAVTPESATPIRRFFEDYENETSVESVIREEEQQLTSGSSSGASWNVGRADEEGNRFESVCLAGPEGQEEKVDRLAAALSRRKRQHRWVDYCGGGSSSSSSSGGTESSNSSAEGGRLLTTIPRREVACERDSASSLRFAPWYDGDGADAVASDGQNLHHHHRNRAFGGAKGNLHHHPNTAPCSKNPHDNHQQHVRYQPARRLPRLIDAYARRHQHRQENAQDNASISRIFAWSVLLHGCLCEAPLAVIEGVARGPLYLLAAAWVAVVALVGTTGHPEHRTELKKHAAALAREGLLFLMAALTLAVPFSTSCTVYGEVAEDEAWDVRPVPTPLGHVDPLRFFVFAFGQAGELAANGRPEPLLLIRQEEQRSSIRIAADSHHSPSPGCRGSFTSPLVGEVATSDDSEGRSAPTLPPRPTASPRFVGAIAAQSMDADRLGAGMILHPPHVLGLRFRKAGSDGRRAALSGYRCLETSAATAYRRIRTVGMAVARLGRGGSRSGSLGALSDTGGSTKSSLTGSSGGGVGGSVLV